MKWTASCLVVMGAILILASAVMQYLSLSDGNALTHLRSGYRLYMIIFGTIMVFIGVGMGFASLDRSPRAE